MQEKRELAREHKKLGKNFSTKERRDVHDHFKKDVWVVFDTDGYSQFWSSRKLISLARRYGKFRPARMNTKKKYIKQEVVIEPPLEDADAAGWYPDEHFCKNCPEYIDWEEYSRLTGE